ncbi:MAG: RES domain-containing protein [Candidatus Polarisedimenticolia bacterium]
MAADEHGAFIETFGQSTGCNTVTMNALACRVLTRVETRRPLRLIDVAGRGGLARIGADARLCSGDRAIARRWAQALRGHTASPDGIHYPSRHDPSRAAAALFDHAATALRAGSPTPRSAPKNPALLGRVLEDYGFALIEE